MRNVRHKGKDKIIPLDTKCIRMFGSVNFNEQYVDGLKLQDNEKYQLLLKARFQEKLTNNKYVMEYYFIIHYETDTLHIHFALILKAQVQLSTMLNYLADSLGVNSLAVNITRLDSLCGALRYFLHKDRESIELGKKMYDESDMVHNQSDFIYKNYLNSNSDDDISIPHLVYLALGCSCESEIYLHLESTKFCNKYKYLIHTIWNDKLQLKEYLDSYVLPF